MKKEKIVVNLKGPNSNADNLLKLITNKLTHTQIDNLDPDFIRNLPTMSYQDLIDFIKDHLYDEYILLD